MKKLLSVLSVFAVTAIAAGAAFAGSINTPAGLNPGDSFRLVFVTSTQTAATSNDLATYDNFVSTNAAGTTYNGNQITWQAIVSNTTINARDHIGLQSTSLTPIYTVSGTLVSTGNLWSGALLNPINKGVQWPYQYHGSVWSGTLSDGTSSIGSEMGTAYPNYALTGTSSSASSSWIAFGPPITTEVPHLYGISSILTVPSAVPEPSTAMLAGLGGLAALVYSFKRKRNSCRR
jgi:hypothetical protein